MEKDKTPKEQDQVSDDQELLSRRAYLISLKKWSKVVIGGVVLGGLLTHADTEAEARSWANRRGGWANGGWVNRRGGSWSNSGGSWSNRGRNWSNGGGSWGNRPGGSWSNRY